MPIQPGVMHAPPSVAYQQNIDLHPELSKPGRSAENAAPAPASIRSARHVAQSDAPEAVRTALVNQAREKSLQPTPRTTLARSDVVEKCLDRSAELLQQAKQVGVDTANRTFMRKCAQCLGHGLVLGVAAALTVMSVGGAAPLLAAASVVFAVSAGDAMCAYKNREAAKDIAEGKPAQLLIGGSSIISNLSMLACRALADKFGKEKDEAGLPDPLRYQTADKVAKVFASLAEAGLVAASFATGAGISLTGMVAAKAVMVASKAGGALVALSASLDSGLVGGNMALGKLSEYFFAAQNDGSDPLHQAVPRKGEALTDLNFSMHYLLAAQKADPIYFEEIASDDQKKLIAELQTLTQSPDSGPAQLELSKDLGQIGGDPGNAWSKMIAFGAGVAGIVRSVATA